MNADYHPRARQAGLVTQPLDDELLVFDSETSRAHSLNAAAAAVWKSADGTLSPEQIAERCQLDPLAVDLALGNLADLGLLDEVPQNVNRVSRRAALRRIGVAGVGVGVAIPVIRSIVAPSPALAGSTAGTYCGSQPACTNPSSYCTSHNTCEPGNAAMHGTSLPCSTNNPCAYPLGCASIGGGIHQCH